MAELTQYELSRSFVDFAFENPEKVKPMHYAIFFFAMEHCNRLGWKQKFGLPTSMVLDAIGVKSHNTFKRHFDELATWGFFKVHEFSRNQYSSNIISLSIALSKNNKALNKALVRHDAKHRESTMQSTGESTGSIDKPNNHKPNNQEPITILEPLLKDSEDYFPDPYGNLTDMKDDFLKDTFAVSMVCQKGVPHERVEGWLDAFNRRLIFTKDTAKNVQEYRSHFANWLVKVPNYRNTNPVDYEPINDPQIQAAQNQQSTITPLQQQMLDKYGTKH